MTRERRTAVLKSPSKMAYVSMAIDKSSGYCGTGWDSTDSDSSTTGSVYWAIQGCENEGGTADGFTDGLTTEYSSLSSQAASVGYWGTFTSNKSVEAIATAYQELGTPGTCRGYPNCENYCLVSVQDVFGWTGGGSWATPPATYAQDGFEYLNSQGDIFTGMPANPPDGGSLVWFGPQPYGANSAGQAVAEGHVGLYLGDDDLGDGQFLSARGRPAEERPGRPDQHGPGVAGGGQLRAADHFGRAW